jgi:hypothetical protein
MNIHGHPTNMAVWFQNPPNIPTDRSVANLLQTWMYDFSVLKFNSEVSLKVEIWHTAVYYCRNHGKIPKLLISYTICECSNLYKNIFCTGLYVLQPISTKSGMNILV